MRYTGGWPEGDGGLLHATSGQPRVPRRRATRGCAMSAAAAVAGSQGLWFVSRASGLALLVMFSAVVVLGVAARLGSAPRRWPKFAVAGGAPHAGPVLRGLPGLHVLTAILDPFVTIGWAATVLPFASGYRTLAIGLGTLAVDLGAAVLLTSLVRARLGYRAWRAVHWLAYLAWPVAFVHSLTAGGRPGAVVGRADRVGLRRRGGHRDRWPASWRRIRHPRPAGQPSASFDRLTPRKGALR